METQRTRICICYLITAFLISIFIYTLISSNLRNSRQLTRLKEEVDEIAHVVLHSPSVGGGGGESKQLNEVIDAILKKRLAGIWDDIYTVKKQLKAAECSSLGGGGKRKDAVGENAVDRVNYAAEDLGAKIMQVVAEPVGGTNIIKSLLRLDYSCNPPVNMLRPSMEPGSCFAFKYSTAEVTVQLAKEIYIESIELEHITQGYTPTADITSAPKAFSVFGLDSNNLDMETSLGSFQYENAPAQRIQLFAIKMVAKFRYIRLKFERNHGNPNFTCVYRISVYGRMNY